MATTPTLKPKTLQEVLAEQAKTVTPVASPTASINQAQLEANKAKAAEREAARQATTPTGKTISKTINPDAPSFVAIGGPQYTSSDFPDQTFTREQADAITSNPIYSRTTRTTPTVSNIKPSTTAKTDLYTPPKVQVGKLVSDFNATLKKTGSDKDAYYAGINYAGLTDEDKKRADTLFDMRQKAKKTPVATTAPVVPANMFDTYKTDTKELTKKEEEVTEKGRKEMISNEEAINADAQKMNDELISEITSYQNEFETKQNDLLSSYESNRLNQVQGDIRRALLSRGVDISKIPQEQLLALSGEIGAKAFSDISGAKERAISAIENARQNKIAKIQQLKANKLISNSESKRQIANINSTADQAILNSKMKEVEVVFGIEQAKKADVTSTDATTAQNRASILSTAGFTNTTTTPEVLAIFDSAATVGEAYNKLKRYIAANPELAKTLDEQLKSSGGGSLSDQLGLLNYQLNVQKFGQENINDAYARELKAAEATTGTTAQKNAAIQAVIQKYSGTASPTPASGGA